ncbi:MAG: hypothetical protein NT045_03205, partial [Candidatus Aureabacteria bacterium]|nr:hypothetical protein [Candidatus Auribacterota bacterium]
MKCVLWMMLALAFVGAVLVAMRPAATPSRASADQPPVIPLIDAAMKARLREVYLRGQATGNHPDTFSKIGDSITATYSFLAVTIGCDDYNLAGHAELQAAIDYFKTREFTPDTTDVWCGVSNSFSRVSRSAESGWSAASALET